MPSHFDFSWRVDSFDKESSLWFPAEANGSLKISTIQAAQDNGTFLHHGALWVTQYAKHKKSGAEFYRQELCFISMTYGPAGATFVDLQQAPGAGNHDPSPSPTPFAGYVEGSNLYDVNRDRIVGVTDLLKYLAS